MSLIATTNGLSAGDLVYCGKGTLDTGAIVWRIVSIYQATEDKQYAVLRSGMTERTATVPVERLRRFTPRISEPYRD